MKRFMALCLLCVFACAAAGCGSKEKAPSYVYAAQPDSSFWNVGSSSEKAMPLEVQQAEQSGEIVEIQEKMFIAQSNDIYLNPEDYLGKYIRYEGLFVSYEEPGSLKDYFYVIRYGPGCCSYDGEAGFEVVWRDGEKPIPMFEQNAWVQVTGILGEYGYNGWPILYLDVLDMREMDVRGAETVLQ